ncbi:MAG TPA: hypothetical protein VMR95_00815 [Candidatus Binatia bacterium]|nr:hypothetical protein [Candidatus Binatia bacterium]
MSTKAKKAQTPLIIPRTWQIAFVVIFIIYWLAVYAYIDADFLFHNGYTSRGTYAIEFSFTLYPAVYFLVAFLLLPNPKNRLRRWFWAIFVALMGVSLWQTISVILNRIWPSLTYWNEKGTGIWDTVGGEWLQMIIFLLLFGTSLLIIRRKKWLPHG